MRMYGTLLVLLGLTYAAALPVDSSEGLDFVMANLTELWKVVNDVRQELDYHLHHGIDGDGKTFEKVLQEVTNLEHEYLIHHLHQPHEGHTADHDDSLLQHLEDIHLSGHTDHDHHHDEHDHKTDDAAQQEGSSGEEDSSEDMSGSSHGDPGHQDDHHHQGSHRHYDDHHHQGSHRHYDDHHHHDGDHHHQEGDHHHQEGDHHHQEGDHHHQEGDHHHQEGDHHHQEGDHHHQEGDHHHQEGDHHHHNLVDTHTYHGLHLDGSHYSSTTEWIHATCDLEPNAELPESHIRGSIHIARRENEFLPGQGQLFIEINASGFDEIQDSRVFGVHVHETPLVDQNCNAAGGYLKPRPGIAHFDSEHLGALGDHTVNSEGNLKNIIIASMDADIVEGEKNIAGYPIVVHELGFTDASSSFYKQRLACCNIKLAKDDHHHH